MFFQVVFIEKDRKYYRLLWRDFDFIKFVDVYEVVRLIFGVKSIFLFRLVCVVWLRLRFERKLFYSSYGFVLNMYTDDIFYLEEIVEDVVFVREDLIKVLGGVSFYV